MNKDSLLERRAAAESRYEELQKQYNDIGVELTKLQGEFRVLTDLINQPQPPVEGEVVDANTITVDEGQDLEQS